MLHKAHYIGGAECRKEAVVESSSRSIPKPNESCTHLSPARDSLSRLGSSKPLGFTSSEEASRSSTSSQMSGKPVRRMNSALPAEPATELADRIAQVDWHFTDAKTQGGVHSIHPYPAKFIPQLPRQLLSLLTPRSEAVIFDPFCGSGTTLVEAQSAGFPSVGVDLNPIATLIARAKTKGAAPAVHPAARSLSSEAKGAKVAVPDIPRIDHWFSKDVQRALAAIVAAIARVDDPAVQDDLRVVLSSIIVRVSFQDGDTRYAAVQKNVDGALVFDLFERAALELDRARESHFGLFRSQDAPARVLTGDILTMSPDAIGPVDLVITSPPYPNAYEYWLYHKYRMYWLGLDPIAVRKAEIGARPHFFKKNAHTAEDFQRQMAAVFRLLGEVLAVGGYACFVVGDSRIHGQIVDNVALLKRAASAEGFRLEAVTERGVPSTRKAFNPANSRATSEFITVFAR